MKWKSRAHIREHSHKLTDRELELAYDSLIPDDIGRITDKVDRCEALTEAEERRLDEWESSPESGLAGSLMGGAKQDFA